MTLSPARLDPVFHLRPWGALSLAPLFPQESQLAEPIGEAWMTSSDSRFADGHFAGKTLGQAWLEMPPEWAGTQAQRTLDTRSPFPLLVKFIFAEDKLSVQVHPDDAYASKHEQAAGGRGKTEMWYIIAARPGAEVLAGLKPWVTRENFVHAIADASVEECLERVPVSAGDAIFVPAGTVHSIGPGLVLCEIQQQSDLTYRVYDYDRRDAQGQSRPLHIEKALEVIRFGKQSGGRIEPVPARRGGRAVRGGIREAYLAACPYFAAEKWDFHGKISTASSCEHFDLLIFLEGGGIIEWPSGRAAYAPAQVWMVPAALGEYQFFPGAPTSLLRTYVPGNLGEYVRRLEDQGVTGAELSRVVHS
ncbi:MAG: type I phosphomannose isomerase catalytic subunit [Candidatus Acidiferrales bacterium]